MKIKNTIAISWAMLPLMLAAQSHPVQHKLYATGEKAMHRIYEQLLDSTLANQFLSYGSFSPMENKDTVMKIEQYCYWYGGKEYVCESNRYDIYLSNSKPIVFYERFLGYLKSLGEKDNNFYKHYSVKPLDAVREIIIKQYESGKLNKTDSIKALKLIEQVTLSMVNDGYNYYFLYGPPKYMTNAIRQALIKAIEHPFYPESYLNFYMKEVVDTCVLDTTGIPIDVVERYKKGRSYYSGELNYMYRLAYFSKYKAIGDKTGISPGQAYLKEKRDEFTMKGYLSINIIVDYVVRKKDTVLIPYLEEFKKKHPDYPLKPF
jgi:hypothetical protein